jgi:hypothetical protein
MGTRFILAVSLSTAVVAFASPVLAKAKAVAPVPDLRISSDGRGVEVQRASDKVPVMVPVLDKCGDPAVGPPKVRDVRMVKGAIVATYGKHCWATIDVTTLAIECTGCD